MAEKTKYGKESFKSPPKSVRFDLEKMDFAMRSEHITSPQRLVDFLLTDYWYRKRVVVQDLTKPNIEAKPPSNPLSNFSINTQLSGVNGYLAEIEAAKTLTDIENTMKEVEKDKKLNAPERLRIKTAAQNKGAEIDQ